MIELWLTILTLFNNISFLPLFYDIFLFTLEKVFFLANTITLPGFSLALASTSTLTFFLRSLPNTVRFFERTISIFFRFCFFLFGRIFYFLCSILCLLFLLSPSINSVFVFRLLKILFLLLFEIFLFEISEILLSRILLDVPKIQIYNVLDSWWDIIMYEFIRNSDVCKKTEIILRRQFSQRMFWRQILLISIMRDRYPIFILPVHKILSHLIKLKVIANVKLIPNFNFFIHIRIWFFWRALL